VERRMRIRAAGAAWALTLAMGIAAVLWQPAQAAVEASAAWTRATPPGVTVAVGYFTLKNTSRGRRELLKITAPIANQISLHLSSIDANGVAHMWPVGKLELEPGEVRRFEPNGLHLMLEGLSGPLLAGMHIPVTIVFEDEDPIVVQFEVRPLVDEHAGHDGHDGHAEHHEHH
jgi:copper(I)-binding protein